MTKAEAIDALDNLLGMVEDNHGTDYDEAIKMAIDALKQPERRVGKWIKHNDKACWFCSECKEVNYYAYCWNSDTGKYEIQDHYCPNCGSEMRGDEDD